jgi:hypothetical protein
MRLEHNGDNDVDGLLAKENLNALNYLNLLFYIANVVIVYLVGASGMLGLPSNSDQSLKYQTLVTPIGRTFSIWAVIYVFQAIWAILQLLPKFRAHPYVQKGVSYWYIAACIAQIIWTFMFAFDLIVGSLIFISVIAITLAGCVIGCYYQYSAAEKTLIEFWFLLFPFAIHFGWLLIATVANVNIVVVWAKASAVAQITVAICSLALLHACGVWALFVPARPNYTVPIVISWATLGIYFQLDSSEDSITAAFDTTTIQSLQYSAVVICALMLLFVCIRVLVAIYKQCTGRNIEVHDTSEDLYVSESAEEQGKV